MRPVKKTLTLVATAILALGLAACDGEDSSTSAERTRQGESYDHLVANQPAKSMTYSPTRETINFWIDTWNEPGKLSYVYLQGANGDLLGYYILEGLPVSYCAMLTPNYKIHVGANNSLAVPAPGMDGAYYSGDQCNAYYGKDATTGAYVEYTAGLGINVLLYDAPLPRQDVQPLGPTTVEDVD